MHMHMYRYSKCAVTVINYGIGLEVVPDIGRRSLRKRRHGIGFHASKPISSHKTKVIRKYMRNLMFRRKGSLGAVECDKMIPLSSQEGMLVHAVLVVDGTNILCRATADARKWNDLSVQQSFEDYLRFLVLNCFARKVSLIVVFDHPGNNDRDDGPTSWRKDIEPKYLSRRMKRKSSENSGSNPPSRNAGKLKPFMRTVDTLGGYSLVARVGFEADDVIGAVCSIARKLWNIKGLQSLDGQNDHEIIFRSPIIIASGDMDMIQFVDKDVSFLHVLSSGTSKLPLGVECMDDAAFCKQYGFPSSSYPDYLALIGKRSSSIGGIGVTHKTAKSLLSKFQTIEQAALAEEKGLLKGWNQKIRLALRQDSDIFKRLCRKKSIFKAKRDPHKAFYKAQLDELTKYIQLEKEYGLSIRNPDGAQMHAAKKMRNEINQSFHVELAWLRPPLPARMRELKPLLERLQMILKAEEGLHPVVHMLSPCRHPVDIFVDGKPIMLCCKSDIKDGKLLHEEFENPEKKTVEEFCRLFLQLDGKEGLLNGVQLNDWMKHNLTLLKKEGLKPLCIPYWEIPLYR